jgi:hypothetical protein
MTSEELYRKERTLKNEIVKTIRTLLDSKSFGNYTLETPVDDDCNNTVHSIDKENVNCQNTVYCLDDLSIDDGLYFVSLLEDSNKIEI